MLTNVTGRTTGQCHWSCLRTLRFSKWRGMTQSSTRENGTQCLRTALSTTTTLRCQMRARPSKNFRRDTMICFRLTGNHPFSHVEISWLGHASSATATCRRDKPQRIRCLTALTTELSSINSDLTMTHSRRNSGMSEDSSIEARYLLLEVDLHWRLYLNIRLKMSELLNN